VSAFFLGFCIILGFQFENLWPRIKESQREKKEEKKRADYGRDTNISPGDKTP